MATFSERGPSGRRSRKGLAQAKARTKSILAAAGRLEDRLISQGLADPSAMGQGVEIAMGEEKG